MSKIYQVLNFQYNSVAFFTDLDEAKRHIDSLLEIYDEKFLIIEHTVIYLANGRGVKK